MHSFRINGRNILVTGASSGIGRGIALTLSKHDANVILTGRNKERLTDTFEHLEPGEHSVFPAELSDTVQIAQLADSLPVLNGLVLCAGTVHTAPVRYISDEAMMNIFQINCFSSIQLLRKLLRSKKIAKEASIVFISSIGSSIAVSGNALYAATKGSVNSFARVMALELAPKGIRVNVVQPGSIPTGLLANEVISKEQMEKNASFYPLGIGTPEDVAYACIYLLSDASRWMTGASLVIDGGRSLI